MCIYCDSSGFSGVICDHCLEPDQDYKDMIYSEMDENGETYYY